MTPQARESSDFLEDPSSSGIPSVEIVSSSLLTPLPFSLPRRGPIFSAGFLCILYE